MSLLTQVEAGFARITTALLNLNSKFTPITTSVTVTAGDKIIILRGVGKVPFIATVDPLIGGGSSGGAKYVGSTSPDPAVNNEWYLPTGEYFVWDGEEWFQPIYPTVPATSVTTESQKKPYLWA